MKKPKIAFIHPAIGESTGGSQVFVLELADRLRDKCDITILSSSKLNDLCTPVKCVSRGKSASSNSLLYKYVKKNLEKVIASPDIVVEHVTSFFSVLGNILKEDYDLIFPNNDWGGLFTASVARRIKGTPVLFTEHCGYMEGGKIARRNLGFKPDKYITLSESMKYWVKKYFKDINVDYIPNGVSFERFNPYVQPKKVDLPSPIVLSSSRYQANKRLDLVIEAVKNLNASLLILSSGKNLDSLEEKGISMLGNERFKIMSVPYHEVASYYRACDVFTLPSQYEPFGLVYLEAMACNKPVIAPKDYSRMNIIGNAGILCDVTDIDEYTEAIDSALNTDWETKPFEQAQKFTWENCAEKYYKAIVELVNQ